MKKTVKGIATFLLITATVSFNPIAWADATAGDPSNLDEEKYTALPGDTGNNNGGPNAGGYTDKPYSAYTEKGRSIYRHPNQPSFTGPFDYGVARMPYAESQPRTCNCFTFDATRSSSFDGKRLTYLWDFGDGQTSDKPVIRHCFDKPGQYTVTLTAKDNSGRACDTGLNSTKVDVNFPPQAVAGPEKQACLGQAVTFDGSSSSSPSNSATYTWDFGDGETAQGTTANHSYKQVGTYRVLLTVDDGKNTQCSIAQAATTARIFPNANVTLQVPESACIARNILFEAQGSSGKYHWDFGDGTVSDGGSKVSHSYQKAGTYTILVTTDDGRGSACSKASDTKKINIGEPPVANAGENTACLAGNAVNFDGSKSSSPTGNLSYNWNFGDGETAEGERVTHTYQKSGNYRVVLTVNNGQGGDCSVTTDSFVANVHSQPEAVINVR